MKNNIPIFETTPCIIFSELKDYLSGSLSRDSALRVEKHLAECELCSSALQGFETMPVMESEIAEINTKIDSLSKPSPFLSGRGWAISLSVISLAGLMLILVFQKGEKTTPLNPPAETANIFQETEVPPTENTTEVPTVDAKHSRTENVPIKRTKFMEKKEIYFLSDAATSPPDEPAPMPEISSSSPEPQTSVPAEQEEKPLPYEYNAPVRYIEDLLITDFVKHYHLKNEAGFKNRNLGPQFENEGTKEENNFADKSPSIGADVILRRALIAFKKGSYALALENFNLLLDVNTEDVNSVFYSGLCQLNAGMPENAIPLFRKVTESPNNVFHQEAKWYTALALLEKKENDEAKKLLTEIADSKGYYYLRAKQKLKSLW